ncbi:hypothetical protein Tco_0432177 [Tanacetum coccineum]
MSSPDHPTANLEDVFSSNFPNYVPPASPDYIPTSPGKTYSSASNSFGIVPLTSPTLSLFPDDPYMKALQAFYTEKSPIPSPIIIPPKTQEFFLQLSPIHLPHPNLKLLRLIENGNEGLGKGTIIIQRDFDALAAELQQAHTQITKLQRKQIGSNHKISLARYRIAELAEVINDMETRHQEDIEKLMNSIIELQNRWCHASRCKYWYEDEEKTELGNEDYDPPKNSETLSLGRKNGSRFKKMIMEEMEEVLENDREDSDNET